MSTGKAGLFQICARITCAVLGPTPGSVSSSGCVCGIFPLKFFIKISHVAIMLRDFPLNSPQGLIIPASFF